MATNTINDALTAVSGETMFAGRYRIVRQLGQGGMGSVWLAEDTQLDNKPFAIKMLPSILVANKRAYRQLKDEALVAMKLTHPNIVTLRAFEENNGNPFLVMDYVDGQTLDDYLTERGKLDESEVVHILKPIAAALDYAHGEGVVHRDVKPANVMIRTDGHPFVLDFGIAREIQETLTRVTGKLSSGTLLYMSPEQLHGAPPKASQDIYSFAAMAYECLKGEPPFSRGQVEYQIDNDTPAPLVATDQQGDGGQVGGLAAGVMAGLSKKPEDRPVTCVAVLEGNVSRRGEETRGLAGRVVPHVPQTQSASSYKDGKGGGAWKVILAMGALGLAIGGGVWYYNHQQEAARVAAELQAQEEASRRAEQNRKATNERRAKEEAKRKIEEKRRDEARKEAATEIRIEAKVQQGKVGKISDSDGFKARKDELDVLFARAEALFEEKVQRWSEAAQVFSNYVDRCKALIKLDEERQDAVKNRIQAQEAFRKAEAAGAKKFAATSWNVAVKTWKDAEDEFGGLEFSSACDAFAAAADQFVKCGEEAQKEEEKEKSVVDKIEGANGFLRSLLKSLEKIESVEGEARRADEYLKRIQKADPRGVSQDELNKATSGVEKVNQVVAHEREALIEQCSTNSLHVPLRVRLVKTSQDYRTAVGNLSALKNHYTNLHPEVRKQDEIIRKVIQRMKEAINLALSSMERAGSVYYASVEDALRVLEQDLMAFEFLEWKIPVELRIRLRYQYEVYEGAYWKMKDLLVAYTQKHPEVVATKRQMDDASTAFKEAIRTYAGYKSLPQRDAVKRPGDLGKDESLVMQSQLQHNAVQICDDSVSPADKSLSSVARRFQNRVAKDSGTVYLQEAIMPFVWNGSLPGAIGVLHKNGLQETACMGWANVEKRIPMSMDRTFMICSQSKGFCGVSMALLMEEGKIGLDDPVSRYLPQFSSIVVEHKDGHQSFGRHIAQREMTIRHLLTNCAGFPFDVPSRLEKGWTSCPISKAVEEAVSRPLIAEPGTKYQYSNVGYEVAAAIIEVVSGKSYELFLKERILDPLGMGDTTFKPTDEQLSRQIAMYTITKTDVPKYCPFNQWMPLPHNGPSVYVSASSGLWSTANDMLKFYKMLMFGGIGANGVRILKERTVREVLAVSQVQSVPKAVGYSLGFSMLQDGWFGHGGAWGTYCKVNIDKQELMLKVVQLCGGPRPWDAKWEMATNAFFGHSH